MSAALDYADFLASKVPACPATGLDSVSDFTAPLFPFQADITSWALRRGRAAVFADCGLGKTPIQLEWARQIMAATEGRVLVLAPLAVAQQTVAQAPGFGITAHYARNASEIQDGITVTNYERLDSFDIADFDGVVLDESSILKSFDGATRTTLTEAFRNTPYRLCCTATPAPNDFMELGTHAEFLGIMSRAEMLATFFIHDGGETQNWRLKGHAEADFWKWITSWAVMIRKPSDLGYGDEGYELPPCDVRSVVVDAPPSDGELFATPASTLQERIKARRASISERVDACAELVNDAPGSWVIWCQLNSESQALAKAIPDAVEVTGSDPADKKESAMLAFARGEIRVLISKPSICGFGMNWQHCHQMAFVGLSDSWEQYYQAVRRCWRFGQTEPVTVHCITAETEGAVVANIRRKEADAERMATSMLEHTRQLSREAIQGSVRTSDEYVRDVKQDERGDRWTLYRGDCVEVLREQPDASVDFSIFSPPFASLYTYSASDRDLGNCLDHGTFFAHFAFVIKELYRVLKPGRLVSFHCMNLPTSKARDGVIGLTDFRGQLIKSFQGVGFVYHSEVAIWKDPVTAMQRTKALGLLHKTIRKDSSMSRQGIADYLVTMRKPGENAEPISHTPEEFPVSLWQRYASPVWMDIDPQDTLQYRSARENADERHICPLQLEVIRRALMLWSNPGDVVLSPFAGIGSEGVVALEEGRRFLGIELKGSYFGQAARNLANACEHRATDLFSQSESAA